jgi:hypothetical protein
MRLSHFLLTLTAASASVSAAPSTPVAAARRRPTGSTAVHQQSARQRMLFKLMDTAQDRLDGDEYDPLSTVRIVNALQPLGKERALEAVSSYLRGRRTRRQGLFLVLRALFAVPDPPGYMPRVHIGRTHPEPRDPRRAPRFPLLLVDDVPLMLVRGYTLAGYPEPVLHHVDEFRRWGVFRNKPLEPAARSLDLMSKVDAVTAWIEEDAQTEGRGPDGAAQRALLRHLVRSQLQRLENGRSSGRRPASHP